jgi:hypothetical protein
MISRQRNGVALAPLAWNLCDLVPMIAEPEGGPSSDMQRYEG